MSSDDSEDEIYWGKLTLQEIKKVLKVSETRTPNLHPRAEVIEIFSSPEVSVNEMPVVTDKCEKSQNLEPLNADYIPTKEKHCVMEYTDEKLNNDSIGAYCEDDIENATSCQQLEISDSVETSACANMDMPTTVGSEYNKESSYLESDPISDLRTDFVTLPGAEAASLTSSLGKDSDVESGIQFLNSIDCDDLQICTFRGYYVDSLTERKNDRAVNSQVDDKFEHTHFIGQLQSGDDALELDKSNAEIKNNSYEGEGWNDDCENDITEQSFNNSLKSMSTNISFSLSENSMMDNSESNDESDLYLMQNQLEKYREAISNLNKSENLINFSSDNYLECDHKRSSELLSDITEDSLEDKMAALDKKENIKCSHLLDMTASNSSINIPKPTTLNSSQKTSVMNVSVTIENNCNDINASDDVISTRNSLQRINSDFNNLSIDSLEIKDYQGSLDDIEVRNINKTLQEIECLETKYSDHLIAVSVRDMDPRSPVQNRSFDINNDTEKPTTYETEEMKYIDAQNRSDINNYSEKPTTYETEDMKYIDVQNRSGINNDSEKPTTYEPEEMKYIDAQNRSSINTDSETPAAYETEEMKYIDDTRKSFENIDFAAEESNQYITCNSNFNLENENTEVVENTSLSDTHSIIHEMVCIASKSDNMDTDQHRNSDPHSINLKMASIPNKSDSIDTDNQSNSDLNSMVNDDDENCSTNSSQNKEQDIIEWGWKHAVASTDHQQQLFETTMPNLAVDSSPMEQLNDTMEEMDQMLKYGMDYVLSGRDSYITPVKNNCGSPNIETRKSPSKSDSKLGQQSFNKLHRNVIVQEKQITPNANYGNSAYFTPKNRTKTGSSPKTRLPSPKICTMGKSTNVQARLVDDSDSTAGMSPISLSVGKLTSSLTSLSSLDNSIDDLKEKLHEQLSNLYRGQSPSSSTNLAAIKSTAQVKTVKTRSIPKYVANKQETKLSPVFKTPLPTAKTFALTPKIQRSQMKNIVSPVGMYIHKSATSPLVKKINRPTVQRKYFHDFPDENLSENATNFAQSPIPKCVYRSANTVKVLEENPMKLPKKIKKFFATPTLVIKHESRVKGHVNNTSRLSKNDSANLLNDSAALFNRSVDANDVSVRIVKEALRNRRK